MSGGLRGRGLVARLALEEIGPQQGQIESSSLGNTSHAPFADRRRFDLAQPGDFSRAAKFVDQDGIRMWAGVGSVHGASIGAPNSEMQGQPLAPFVRLP